MGLGLTVAGLLVFGSVTLVSRGVGRWACALLSLYCLGRLLTYMWILMLIGQGVLSPEAMP